MALTTDTDAPPQPTPLPRVTRADVERDVARTQATVDQVVAMLSLQPPNSPCHNVTGLYSGLYVPVHLFPGKHINVYAHPWSRGWSIFADEAPRPAPASPTSPQAPVILPGAYSWRHVSKQYMGLQRPLYCPRDKTGPWHVPPEQIVEAIIDITDHLGRLDRIRRARFRKRHWYWPTTLERKEGNIDANR
jgi:hypothetical protein